MPLVGMPSFSAKQKLLAAQLNQLVSTVVAKFNGAITGSDMAWPMTALGNFNANGNQIQNVARFWNMYDITQYLGNIQGLLDTISALGGGTIFIPANTTVTTTNLDFNNNSASLSIIGAGISTSTLRMTTAATSDLLRVTCGSIDFRNFRFDGNLTGSATKALLRISTVTTGTIQAVRFVNSNGYGLQADFRSAAGSGCLNVRVVNCHFAGNQADCVRLEDAANMTVCDSTFLDNTTAIGVNLAPQSGSALMRHILISANQFIQNNAATKPTIKFRDSSAGATVSGQQEIFILNNNIRTLTSSGNPAGIEVWSCSSIRINNNQFTLGGSTSPCVYIRKSLGVQVNENEFHLVGGDCIVIGAIGGADTSTIRENTVGIVVNANVCYSAGYRMLVLGFSNDWIVSNNNCISCNTAVLAGLTAAFELWSCFDGTTTANNFLGVFSGNMSGNMPCIYASKTGNGGASAALGGGAFKVGLTVSGNVDGNAILSFAGGLTNNGSIKDTDYSRTLYNAGNSSI